MIAYENNMKELRLELREAKDQASAATIRARKSKVMNSTRVSSGTPPSKRTSPLNHSGIPRPISARGTKSSNSTPNVGSLKQATGDNIQNIRSKIKELLEKHDPTKVEKLDELMEKFKGKEARLHEKMKVRYLSSPSSTRSQTPDHMSPTVQKRAELAMARHAERMQKIRSPK